MGILRTKRLAAGLSQRELAERAGVARKTVTDLDRDEPRTRPYPRTIRKLAGALGCDPSDLAELLHHEEVTR